MANQVTLSINGRDGVDLTNNRDDHLVPFRAEIVIPGAQGRPGVDAPPANQGEHAGMLRVEFKRSATQNGWIQLRALTQRGSRSIPTETEIPPRSKISFTAIGGKGEPGRTGGNGENGSPGTNGSDATREAEAGEGGAGGAGGNAGSGSNGASGGNGGFIQLIVDEDDLDLLYGVDCHVVGGEGGYAGNHGRPGTGGEGGKGGQPLVWEDIIDTKYRCTSNCIGGSTSVAVLGGQRDATMEMFRRFQQETSNQSAVNRAIATLATASRSKSAAIQGQGVCKCRGGVGVCAGCMVCPVYQTFSRSTGQKGSDGVPGSLPAAYLVSGQSGSNGQVSIIVRRSDGQGLEGNSNYRLRLIDFDVEDGNSDGIFEPGEDIYIRRIQVQNSGGVLSPPRPIACTMALTEGLIDADDLLSSANLPLSIPPGATHASTQSVEGRLSTVAVSAASIPPYRKEVNLGLNAVMPWTLLPLEDFDLRKSILVQYPIELKDLRAATSMVIESTSRLSWKIFNKSLRAFGNGPFNDKRLAKVVVSSNNEHVHFQDEDGVWTKRATLTVPLIPPFQADISQCMVEMHQTFQFSHSRVQYSEVNVSCQLFISPPRGRVLTDDLDISEMHLIETHQAKIQLARAHAYAADDDVLLVTNSASRPSDIESLLTLLRTNLSLKVNTWNMSTYGGLLIQDPEIPEETSSVLAQYQNRTVIVLANSFPLLGDDKKTAICMCDPFSMLAASQLGTLCLFFGFSNLDRDRKDLDHLLRPIDGDAATLMNELPTEARHQSAESLLQSLRESGTRSDRTHLVTISKPKLRLRGNNMNLSAKKLADTLRSEIPQYHFVIGIIPSQKSDPEEIECHLLVQMGLPRTMSIQATQAELLKTTENATVSKIGLDELTRRPTRIRRSATKLSSRDILSILGSLSVAKRMAILDRTERRVPDEIIELIELSVEQHVDKELQNFVDAIGPIKLKGNMLGRFLRESLPGTSQLVEHIDKVEALSEETKRILAYCFAGCRPQSKSKIISESLNPFAQARRLIRKALEESVGNTKDLNLDKPSLGKQRCVSLSLMERTNLLTGHSAYSQDNASYGTFQSLEKNDVLSLEEWNASALKARETEAAVLELFVKFRRQYETMNGVQ